MISWDAIKTWIQNWLFFYDEADAAGHFRRHHRVHRPRNYHIQWNLYVKHFIHILNRTSKKMMARISIWEKKKLKFLLKSNHSSLVYCDSVKKFGLKIVKMREIKRLVLRAWRQMRGKHDDIAALTGNARASILPLVERKLHTKILLNTIKN